MGSFPVLSFWHLLWNDLGVVEGKYWRDRYGWKCGNVLSHSLLELWWVPTRMGLPGFYNSGIPLSSLFVSSKEGWQIGGPTITSDTVLMLGQYLKVIRWSRNRFGCRKQFEEEFLTRVNEQQKNSPPHDF